MKSSQFMNSISQSEVRFNWTAALFILISLSQLSFSCKKEKTKSKKEKSKKEDSNFKNKENKIKLTTLWKRKIKNLTIAADQDKNSIYFVGFRGTKSRPVPKIQSLLNSKDGKIIWQKRRSMSLFRNKTPWAINYSMRKKEILYISRYGSLYSLSRKNGSAGNRIDSKHGFADMGDKLFIGDSTPYFLNYPGFDKKQIVSDMKPLNQGMFVRLATSFPVTGKGKTILLRTKDGFLRAISPEKNKEIWKYREKLDKKLWPADLPLSKNILLVPTIFEKYIYETKIRWSNKDDKHQLTLPGRIRKNRNIMVYNNLVSMFLTDGLNHKIFITINLKSGKITSRKIMASDLCTNGGGFVSCRLNNQLLVFSQKTGKLEYSKTLSHQIKFIAHNDNIIAAEDKSGKINIFQGKSGKKLWSKKLKIKSTRTELKDVLYGKGDRIALLLQTNWPAQSRLNRLYLRLFSTAMPDAGTNIQLGKPKKEKRYSRIRTDSSTIDINTPVWTKDNLIFSAVDGLFRAINVDNGKIIKSFTLPGKQENTVSLLARHGNYVLLDKENHLVCINQKFKKIEWQDYLDEEEYALSTNNTVFIHKNNGFYTRNLKNGKKTKDLFSESANARVISANDKSWYVKTSSGNKLVVDNEIKEYETQDFPDSYLQLSNYPIVVWKKLKSVDSSGSWSGINLSTGKVLWTKKFSHHPAEIGTAKDISQLEPRDCRLKPPFWLRSTPEGFIVPGPSHRCLHSIAPETGEVNWSLCFNKLSGPPIYTQGHLLISAKAPWYHPNSEISSPAENNNFYSIISVSADGKNVEKLWTATGEHNIMLPFKNPNKNEPLVITLFDNNKSTFTRSTLRAFKIE
ncbi:MAG: PQQ-binding-like beta-propeller repeat protein [Myxococcota bacterium]